MRIITPISIVLIAMSCHIQAQAAKMTLYIKEVKTPCTTVIETECLQVKYKKNQEWQTFSAPISGFNFEKGFEYEIIVDKKKINKAAADQNNFSYTFVKMVKKTPKQLPPAANFAQVKASNWYLIGMNEKDVASEKLTLKFDADHPRINLFGGCNNYFGNYTVTDQTISFGPMMGTMMACQDKMNIENAYVGMFDKKHLTYVLEDNYMHLYNGEKHVLTYVNKEQNEVLDFLSKYDWKLIQYNGKLMKMRDINAYISFDNIEGRAYGSDGCNNFGGKVTIDKNKISFGNMMSTMKACTNTDLIEIGTDFGKMFSNKALTYDIADQVLNIYSDNKIIMMFGRTDKKK